MIDNELSFCKVIHLQRNIVEVIPFEEVEISVSMVKEINDYLLGCMDYPFSILINKLHSYSIEFEAQRIIGVLPEIDATAIVSYSAVSQTASAQVIGVSVDQEKASEIFSSREAALTWLKSRLAKKV